MIIRCANRISDIRRRTGRANQKLFPATPPRLIRRLVGREGLLGRSAPTAAPAPMMAMS